MKKILALICPLLCASPLNSHAAMISYYTNETDFLSAISGEPAYTNDFSSIPAGGTRLATNVVNFSGGDFSYTATIPGDVSPGTFWGDTFGGVNALSTGNPDDSFVMTNFSLNTTAFGGYFFPSDGVGVVSSGTVTLTTVFADLTSSSVTNSRASASVNGWFFGWVTGGPGSAVESVTFTAGTDFASSAQVILAVPEPSVHALLGLAGAGLTGYILRRRRA
jgi:hypothetical protein